MKIPTIIIGHLGFQMIHVKHYLLIVLFLLSCDHETSFLAHKKKKLKKYSTDYGLIHLEIESLNGMSQFFYNLTSQDLAKGIVLKSTIEVTGNYEDKKNIIKKIFKDKRNNENKSFLQIIAKTNLDYNSKLPIPEISKTRLISDGSFALPLLENTQYTLILNPFGLEDEPPINIEIDKIENDKKYNFLNQEKKELHGVLDQNFLMDNRYNNKIFYAGLFLNENLVSSRAIIANNGHFYLSFFNDVLLKNLETKLLLKIWPKERNFFMKEITQELERDLLMGDKALVTYDGKDLIDFTQIKINLLQNGIPPLGSGNIIMRSMINNATIETKKAVHNFGINTIEDVPKGIYEVAFMPYNNSPYSEAIKSNININSNLGDVDIRLEEKKIEDKPSQDFIIMGKALEPKGAAPARYAFINIYEEDTCLILGRGISDGKGNFKIFLTQRK